MAVATATSYAGTGKIRGGRSVPLPAWLPAPGIMAPGFGNYMQDIFDVNNPEPLLRGSSGMLNDYGGTLYAKDFGEHGSILTFNGGHQGNMSNAVNRGDMATQLWSRIINATPLGISIADYDSITEALTGEYWTDATKTAVIYGKPSPPHNYGHWKYVPAAIAGNQNGWAVMVGGFCFQAHYIDLDDLTTGWQRLGVNWRDVVPNTQPSSYGSSLIDTKRKRIVCFTAAPNGQDRAITIDIATKAVSSVFADYVESYYTVSDYSAADDLYMTFRLDMNAFSSHVIVTDPAAPPVAGIKTYPPVSGTKPAIALTAEWCEEDRAWYVFDGTNPYLWKLTAPANPRTGVWVWSTVPFVNPTGVLTQTGGTYMFNRLHYMSHLRAFAAVVAVDKKVQFWKL